MRAPDLSVSRRVAELVDASPTPYHAVDAAVGALSGAGFRELTTGEAVPSQGPAFIRRGGALVAWAIDESHSASSGVRVIGAHTDSPNLRIKPRPAAVSVTTTKHYTKPQANCQRHDHK